MATNKNKPTKKEQRIIALRVFLDRIARGEVALDELRKKN